MKLSIKILLIFVLLSTTSIFAQKKTDYTQYLSEKDLRSTVKYLSDDGFEGRGPGTRGGELAAKYIANRLELAGIKAGNNGSYFQPVPLVGLKPDANTKLQTIRKTDDKTFRLNLAKIGLDLRMHKKKM